jgi:hypothetical protein
MTTNVDIKQTATHHICSCFIEGEWAVFRCPWCPDYERRVHLQTGEMQVRGLSAVVAHLGRSVDKEGTA